MAKAEIRKLKMRRFMRWLGCEVYGKPAPKKPIKLNRKRQKINQRKVTRQMDRSFEKVWAMIQEKRASAAQ